MSLASSCVSTYQLSSCTPFLKFNAPVIHKHLQVVEVSGARMSTDHLNWSFDTLHEDSFDMDAPRVEWEEHRKIMCRTKDGTERDRHNFCKVETAPSGRHGSMALTMARP